MKNTSTAMRLLVTIMALMFLTVLSGCEDSEANDRKVTELKEAYISKAIELEDVRISNAAEMDERNAKTRAISKQCKADRIEKRLRKNFPKDAACMKKADDSYDLAVILHKKHIKIEDPLRKATKDAKSAIFAQISNP